MVFIIAAGANILAALPAIAIHELWRRQVIARFNGSPGDN